MKISKEIVTKIEDAAPQIRLKMDVKIGKYVTNHNIILPISLYVEVSDFIYVVDGSNHFLVKNVAGKFDTNSDFHTKLDEDEFNLPCESVTDFLIDFDKAIKNGTIKIYQFKPFDNVYWKPSGDGRIVLKYESGIVSSCVIAQLDEIKNESLRQHIKDEL